MNQLDKLLYGKSGLQHIVGLEVTDSYAEVFQENPKTGLVTSLFIPNKFWILSDKPFTRGFVRLEGEQHYKWGKQFETREDFLKFRGKHKHTQDLYSIYDPREAMMVKDGITFHHGLKVEDVSVLSFDIETTGFKYGPNDKLLLISNTYRKKGVITRKLFAYDEYESQGAMIDAWCTWVREMNPSYLVGHNIFSFDLWYLNEVAKKNDTALLLGRDKSEIKFNSYESKFRKDQTQDIHYKRAYIYGRGIIDTFFLSIRFDVVLKRYESYGLKQIIKQEGLERENRVFYDASKIRENYKIKEEWEKIKTYCCEDSDDSLALYDLMVPAMFYFARHISKPFELIVQSASGSMINNMMIRSYLQDKHSIAKADNIKTFAGAISWGNPGVYKNAIKWDIQAMYPSLMISNEIYPKNKDPKKYMLQILKFMREERLINKKLSKIERDYYWSVEQSMKIGINSFFGTLGGSGLNYNSGEDALKVTSSGQKVLKDAILWATNKPYEEWNLQN